MGRHVVRCPNCKKEMHESRPKVYYCQTQNCVGLFALYFT